MYMNKPGLSREFFVFSFGNSGDDEDARAREREFFFFQKFTSHTHWTISYRQTSVPAIDGLLLGVVVALILIPIPPALDCCCEP